MKWVLPLLFILLAGLQYRLWVGDGSFPHIRQLEQQVSQQRTHNQELLLRNQALGQDVMALRHGNDAMEESARSQLGLIRNGETFYLVVEGAH